MRGMVGLVVIVAAALAPVVAQVDGADSLRARYFAILEANPLNPTATDRLWELSSVQGRVDDLVADTKRLAANDPRANLPLAGFLERAGDPGGAAAAIEALDPAPLDAAALARVGSLWKSLGNDAKAIAAWEMAAQRNPHDWSLLADLAATCAAAGDRASARSFLGRIAAEAPPAQRLEAREAMAGLLEADGDFASAAAMAEEILDSLEPGHWKLPAATQRVITLADRAGELDALAARWQKDGDPRSLTRMAAVAAHRGNVRERLRWLEDATRAFPADAALLRERGEVELALAELEAAEATFRSLVKLAPSDPGAQRSLAEALALQGREEEAEAAILALPTDDPAGDRRLELFLEWNLREPARRLLERAVTNDPASVDAALRLARFLIEGGRNHEALGVLDGIRMDNPESRATAQAQIAKFLKEARMPGAAEEWARRALESDPGDAAIVLLLADLLEARGAHDQALAAIARAAPPDGPLPDETLDRRLLSALRRADADDNPSLRNAAAKRFAVAIHEHAESANTADAWLRAGRWASWTGDPHASITALREGLRLDPGSPALLENLASDLEAVGDFEGAIETLARGKSAASPDTPAINRRIARLEIARGNPDGAIATLETLRHESPPDWMIARDLAAAMEAAGNNFGAMDVWQEAFTLAPRHERPALLRPILECFARLGLEERATTFVQTASEALPAGPARAEFLRSAMAHGKELGIRSLKEAEPPGLSPATRDPAERAALRASLEEARRQADWDRACDLAARLAQPPDDTTEDHVALASALEAGGRTQEALDAWRRIAARFSRSAETLGLAAEAIGRLGDPDGRLACWRKASHLETVPPDVRLSLGRAAAARGDRLLALADFRTLLDTVEPDPAPSRNPAPLPARISHGDLGLAGPSELDPQGCRLLALAEAGSLLANSPDKLRILNSLAAPLPAERAWAFWHAAEPAPAMDALEPLTHEHHTAPHLCMAMEAGMTERMRAWLDAGEPGGTRWNDFLSAASAMLASGWRPDTARLESLLDGAPAHIHVRLADAMALSGALRLAVAIDPPASLPPQALAEAHFRRAGWQLALGDPDAATTALDRAIELAPPPDSMDSLAAAALRARWLLEEPASRPALEQSYHAHTGENPTAQALFAALAGKPAEFARLIRLSPATGDTLSHDATPARALREGARLESWNLRRCARELYRTAPPPQTAEGRRSLENAIITNRLSEADPALAAFLANEWVARGATARDLMAAGVRATGNGQIPVARTLYEKAFSLAPNDPATWTHLLSLASLPGGFPDILPAWLASASPEEHAGIPPDAILQLSAALEANGRRPEAAEILTHKGLRDPRGRLASRRKELEAPPAETPTPPETAKPQTVSTPESPANQILEDPAKLAGTIRRLTGPPKSQRASLVRVARLLLENDRPDLALDCFAALDRDGIGDHAVALSHAEALWKSGRRDEAMQIAGAIARIAPIDPNLRVPLAAFFSAVDMPERAAAQLDAPDLTPLATYHAAPLRPTIASQLAERGNTDAAAAQLEAAAKIPGAIEPAAHAEILQKIQKTDTPRPIPPEWHELKPQRGFIP
jgi:FimV-like protein